MPSALRVLLCDDAVAYSAIVARWLAPLPDVELVGAVDTGTALLEAVPRLQPDVILLDVVLPDGDSDAERVAQLRALLPGVWIVLVSSMSPAKLATLAREIGANTSCSKATDPQLLIAAIRGEA